MQHQTRNVPIAGTHRNVWPGAALAGGLSDAEVRLTAWLRPKRGGDLDADRARVLGATPPARRTYASRADLARQTDADPADVERLRRYCTTYGIDIVATHWRSAVLSGPMEKMVEAFGATAATYELPDKRRFRHRSESLHAPPEIAEMLRGPFGLHQWPRSHAIGALHGRTVPLSAGDVAERYRFPDADGSGQTVAILQLRGAFREDDFMQRLKGQGVAAAIPTMERVDDAELAHRIETEKDVESAMDTQIVATLAPGAQLVIYAAPDDERGVLDAIRTAVFDDKRRPSILSISFGFPEYLWTPVALTILDELFTAAALVGMSVFCAAGDNGAELDADGTPHVLAPASSPFVHACGGTQIGDVGGQSVESAWERTGGGFSRRFAAPPWQSVAVTAAASDRLAPGRGLPDFAGQAMPGYEIVFNGATLAAGGTSAVAPMWAALAARINQRSAQPIGFFAPLLYDTPAAFRDVTSGGNGLFTSGPGWNACTGLGVPVGDAIDAMLRAPA